ncbi:MAG: hypothetical protein BECKG1743D_GA0114223_107812 [Candidatus Kentron sp. G]|nr:MAG: hypothetical protein BECKG1743F_GA0114225_107402 [Candidatus Kentron sp. G]VFN04514.1 MAG: hypothetical protein BECKG1743E_GA0114224_107402 [Candidatus Kentron sp. G]VFN05880.1 MAG: hypothetical protein BECKG1743D_GA0114223_107812 [Candidatus Kentron sp. G]
MRESCGRGRRRFHGGAPTVREFLRGQTVVEEVCQYRHGRRVLFPACLHFLQLIGDFQEYLAANLGPARQKPSGQVVHSAFEDILSLHAMDIRCYSMGIGDTLSYVMKAFFCLREGVPALPGEGIGPGQTVLSRVFPRLWSRSSRCGSSVSRRLDFSCSARMRSSRDRRFSRPVSLARSWRRRAMVFCNSSHCAVLVRRSFSSC